MNSPTNDKCPQCDGTAYKRVTLPSGATAVALCDCEAAKPRRDRIAIAEARKKREADDKVVERANGG